MNNTKSYISVLSRESINNLIEYITNSKVLAYDIETNSLNVRQGTIIGFSVSSKENTGYYLPTKKYNPETDSLEDLYIDGILAEDIAKKVVSMLVGKKLIMHNGSFDIRFTKNYYGVDLLDSLWVETTLLVHTLEEEGAVYYGKPFALKSIAQMIQEHIGIDVGKAANEEQIILKENIKKNGGSTAANNYEMYKADMEVLSEYACADADLTLRVCRYYLNKLQHEGLVDFFFKDEVMPVYREVTIPMEERGVALDVSLIEKTEEEITKVMDDLQIEITEELFKIDAVKEWLIYRSVQKEFPPNNRGIFAQKLIEHFELDLPKTKGGAYSLAAKNLESLEDSSVKTFLIDSETSEHGIDPMVLLKISVELWKDKNEGYYCNIQSKNQLAEIVFDFMKLEPLSETDKGNSQFNDEYVQHLSKDHKWAERLRVYNKLAKIKSTYVVKLLREKEGDIFYPYFKQHGTVTGRYGSNLQQLPKPQEDGEADPTVIQFNNRIRQFFISRPDYLFIDSDYESLEPHIFASISGDKNLQEIFDKGFDFYSTVAIRTEKLENVSADKKDDNYLKNIYPSKRSSSKSYALGIPYGMSGYALAKTIDVSAKEGEELRTAYLEGFPGVANWMEVSRESFHKTGVVKNSLGRVRHLWRGKKVYDKYGDEIMNYKFRKSLIASLGEREVGKLYGDYRNAINSCLNFQIQSLAASIVNRAALAINRELRARGIDGVVIAQIHDQLIIEVIKESVEEIKPSVKHLMENTTILGGVTLKAPPSIACNFYEGH